MNEPFPPPPLPYGGPPSSNGLATAALVLGILALLAVFTFVLAFVSFIPGVIAIVLGVMGRGRAKQLPDGRGGAIATAGLVCGVLGTLASVAAFAIVAIFVASSDFAVVDTEVAAPDDFELSDRSCRVDGGRAVASGVLTNTSGEAQAWVVTVRFTNSGAELGSTSDELDTELEDGSSWSWETVITVDPERVNTDTLGCRVDRVETGRVVED